MNYTTLRVAMSLATGARASMAQSMAQHALRSQGIRHASYVPTIARPSFWKKLIPKPMRSSADAGPKKARSKEWNPATFFIVIFLFIGSMSMQMIALKKDFEAFTRRSEVRISLLREVVEKIQRGEKVDVERVLGTGNPEREQEWEEVLKEFERDEAMKNQKKKQSEATPKPTSSSPAPASEATTGQATAQIKTGRASFF